MRHSSTGETMSDEYKWLTTNRNGHCVLCNNETHRGDRILWSLIDKSKIWCKTCAAKVGQTDPGSKNEEPSTSSSSNELARVRCDTCHQLVPSGTLTHVITVRGNDVDTLICEQCLWLREAHWGLKLAGMWRPTPRAEPEAKT